MTDGADLDSCPASESGPYVHNWGFLISMATFIINMCYQWKRDTVKCVYSCLICHGWQTSYLWSTTYPVSSPWRPSQMYVEKEQLFFIDANPGHQQLEKNVYSMKWKWRVRFVLRAELPTSVEFLPIQGLYSPPTEYEVMCFLPYCCHYFRKAKDRDLLIALKKILHLIQDSLCSGSHWYQATSAAVSHHTSVYSLEKQSWGDWP